eukprot:14741528-Ditylum_brightwellii.AAC.1
MYDEESRYSRKYCRQQEYYQECIKNPKCLGLLKEYAAQSEEAQHIYEDNDKQAINTTTDDDSTSSSSSSVSSSAKKVKMFPVRNIECKKLSSPDGKKRPIDETNLHKGDKTEYTMLD